MKIKVSEATPKQIDWMVAKCEGVRVSVPQSHGKLEVHFSATNGEVVYSPSTDWAQGGPIIEREGLSVAYWGERSKFGQHDKKERFWECRHPSHRTHSRRTVGFGPTPLIAAMRCYVASKMGEEVEIPDELIGGV